MLAAGGIGYIANTDTAKAQTDVSYGDLQIPSGTHRLDSGEVDSVILSVQANLKWQTNFNVDKWVLRLEVGTAETIPITRVESENAIGQSGETEIQIQGDVLDAPDFSANMFSVSNGGEKTATVSTALRLELVRGDETVTTTKATQDVEITTTTEKRTAEAKVGGTGGVTVSGP
jgi:hypothetical protein